MANKFSKDVGVKGYKETKAEEVRQKQLRKQYKIEDENVKVVEKKTTFKFIINLLISFVKLVVTITLLVLATIGLICLIYPNPRNEFLIVLNEIIKSAREFLGM